MPLKRMYVPLSLESRRRSKQPVWDKPGRSKRCIDIGHHTFLSHMVDMLAVCDWLPWTKSILNTPPVEGNRAISPIAVPNVDKSSWP